MKFPCFRDQILFIPINKRFYVNADLTFLAEAMKSRVRTGTFARQLGLKPCFLPAADSKTVLRSMGDWIED